MAEVTKNNYKILASIDLTKKSDVRGLWQTLETVKKEQFLPDERIKIIYSIHSSKLLLDSVQEILDKIDIPDFFVLYEVNEKPVDDSYTFYLQDNFCFYPWSNLRTDPNGDVRPCCKYSKRLQNSQKENYNINHHTVEEIYFSKELSDLRQKFIKNMQPAECSVCYSVERSGLLSHRQQTKAKYFNLLHELDYSSDTVNNLRILDLNLGNECNLSCRICSEDYSSTIAIEQQSMLGKKVSPLVKASENYFNSLLEISKTITHINIQGGEPLMSKNHFNFLKKLIELGYASNIKLDYATNGTIYSEKFFDIWSKFKQVKLNFSVDDIEKRFEYQRNGAVWSEVEHNIKQYKRLQNKNFILGVHPAVSIQNVYYLPELINWIENLELQYSLNLVKHPAYLSIENLDYSIRESICEKLDKIKNNKEIEAIICTLKSATGSTDKEFFNYMTKLDQHRQQKFSDNHSEIAKIIGFL